MRILFVPAGHIKRKDQLGRDTLLRCQEALDLWDSQEFHYILVAGGIFNPPAVQTVPAAQIMADWFVSHGVLRSRILIEDKSLDTYENIHFSMRLLREQFSRSLGELLVVTHWTHSLRFLMTFRRAHGVLISASSLFYPLGWRACLSECVSLTLHLLDSRGNNPVSRLLRRSRRQS